GRLVHAAERAPATGAAVSSFVQPFDQITRLLKFDRHKESGRHIGALLIAQSKLHFVTAIASRRSVGAPWFDILRRRYAVIDFGSPEAEAALVRFAIQKIEIVLPHEKTCLVDQIGRASCRGRV